MDSHLLTVEYRGRVRLVRVWREPPGCWWARIECMRSHPAYAGDSQCAAIAALLEGES